MVRWRVLATWMIFIPVDETQLWWDEKRVEVEKVETVLRTSFHVNRKKRNWLRIFFFFKMCDIRCICMPVAVT